jgi:hypothetical protein
MCRDPDHASKGDAKTYLVQIFNQPHQISVLRVPDALLILLPIEEVVELIAKPGRGTVEAIELL